MRIKNLLINIYERFFPKMERIKVVFCYNLLVMDSFKTIEKIKRNKISVIRYGDGEFRLMLNDGQIAFQKADYSLRNQLIEALSNKKVLVSIPYSMHSTVPYTEKAALFWKNWSIDRGKQKKVVKLLRKKCGFFYVYGDAFISRPYMDRKDKKEAAQIFSALKELWNQKSILIVEGDQTRLGVGNNLFGSTNRIQRIIAPALDAWEVYSEILDSTIEMSKNEIDLVLVALGPTATVLVSDLAKVGIWAIDIGHIDIEYEWYLSGAEKKTGIPGKYTNEVNGGRVFTDCDDKEYTSQIVKVISFSESVYNSKKGRYLDEFR